jgi:hypothetical protein
MAKTDYKKFLPVKTVIRVGKKPAKIRKKITHKIWNLLTDPVNRFQISTFPEESLLLFYKRGWKISS